MRNHSSAKLVLSPSHWPNFVEEQVREGDEGRRELGDARSEREYLAIDAAKARLRWLPSASNTEVAFGTTTAPRQPIPRSRRSALVA